MDTLKCQIPEGVQDILPVECYNKRALERAIRGVFTLWGYNEIETPSFEYYDVFAGGIGGVGQELTIKFFDQKGRILVLRPDITMSIARLCASRLYADEPLRLCYIGNAFGADSAYYGTQKEFTQAGVELFGLPCPEADAEVVALAIKTLQTAGITDFQIDLGQVEYFKGLMEEAGLNVKEAEELREYLDQKNMLSAEMFLRGLGLGGDISKKIAALANLYGTDEVFERAKKLSSHPRCLAALENLKAVFNILCDFGLKEYLSIDLGLLQSMDYYSGITFKGISVRLGQPILSGGRYDNLSTAFGKAIPATGFALGIKRLLIALEKQGSLSALPKVHAVISGDAPGAVFERMAELQKRGAVELALHLGEAELSAYARKTGARAVYVKGDGK